LPAAEAQANSFKLEYLVNPNSHDSNIPIVDIIFVHGLGGSARGTWTHGKSAFWPIWLPKVQGLENARISTFGYDSKWTRISNPANVLDISHFAEQLLNELRRHYSRHPNVSVLFPFSSAKRIQTQTIFIAHSMGGLVVKKVRDDPTFEVED
jgi:pimeloyl-ACP methyl ester carboxylesterase